MVSPNSRLNSCGRYFLQLIALTFFAWIQVYYSLASIFDETTTSSSTAQEKKISRPVLRDWLAEYPKLKGLCSEEMLQEYNQIPSVTFVLQKVRLRDFLEAIDLRRERLQAFDNGSIVPMSNLNCFCCITENTNLLVAFPSIDERKRDMDGYVSARLVSVITRKEENGGRSNDPFWKGTVYSPRLMARHFRMVKPGEWIRGNFRICEISELFGLDMISGIITTDENLPPDIYRVRGSRTGTTSRVYIQSPSTRQISSLKDLPLDTMTTVTVVGATPRNPFPTKVNPDLARALLNVGFEYREEGRFDKRGQNFGAARKTLSSNIDFRTLYGEENSKMLKPQREFYSNSRDAIFVFESQETSPTWSDDTKVDVFVYMAPQVDEVVKGLLKKKP